MFKLHNYNIILPKYLEIVKKKGSSFVFSASGGWDKEKKVKAAEKILRSPSEGAAEGGCGGNSASPEPKRSPAALLVQSRVPQKSFLFLLEEKIRRAQIKKCNENFFAGQRAKRAAAGRSVKIRSPDFRQKRFGFRPIDTTKVYLREISRRERIFARPRFRRFFFHRRNFSYFALRNIPPKKMLHLP